MRFKILRLIGLRTIGCFRQRFVGKHNGTKIDRMTYIAVFDSVFVGKHFIHNLSFPIGDNFSCFITELFLFAKIQKSCGL